MKDCGDCSVATTTPTPPADPTSGAEHQPSLRRAGDEPTQHCQRQPTNESPQSAPQPRLCRTFGRKISKIVIPEKFAVAPAPSPRAAASSSSGGVNKRPIARQPSAKLRALVGLFERLGESTEFFSKRREPWNPPNWGGIGSIITDIKNRLEAAEEGKARQGNPPGPLTRTWDPKPYMATRELLCLELQRLRHEAGDTETLRPSWVRREVGFWIAESGELDAGRLRPGVRSWVVDWIQRAGVQDVVEALNDLRWKELHPDFDITAKVPGSMGGYSWCGSSGRSRRSCTFGQSSSMGDPPLTPTTISEGYHSNPAYSSSVDWDDGLGSPYPLPLDGMSRWNPSFNPHSSSIHRTSTPVEDIQELCRGSVRRRLMQEGVEVVPAVSRGRGWRRRGGNVSMSSSDGMDPPQSECGSWLAPSEDLENEGECDKEKQGPLLPPAAISSLMKRRSIRGDFTCKYPRQSASGGEEFWSASSQFPTPGGSEEEEEEEETFWTSPSELDLSEMQEFRMSEEHEFPAGIPEDVPASPEDVEVSIISLFDITEDMLDSLGRQEEPFRPSAFTPFRLYTSQPSSDDFDDGDSIDEFFSAIHSSKAAKETSVEEFYSCCNESLVKNAALPPPEPIRRWSSVGNPDAWENAAGDGKEACRRDEGGLTKIRGEGEGQILPEYVSPFNVDKFGDLKAELDGDAIEKNIVFGGWSRKKCENDKGKALESWGARIDAFRPDWDCSGVDKSENAKFRERDLDNIWQLGRLDNEQRNDVQCLGLRFSSDRMLSCFSDSEEIFGGSVMQGEGCRQWKGSNGGGVKKRASWQRRGLFTDSDTEIAGFMNSMEPFVWRDVPAKEKGSINEPKFGSGCNNGDGERPYEQVIKTNISATGCDSIRAADELL